MIRDLVRGAYRALPLKRPVLTALRAVYHPPRAVYDHLYFEGPFEAEVYGVRFKMVNHNTDLETRIFWGGGAGYETETLRLWAHYSRKAEVIFDIGANTGLFSLVARGGNPGAQIYAFEPIERFCDQMRENARLNGFTWNMLPLALSNRNGAAVMYDLPLRQHRHASLIQEQALHAAKTLVERSVQTARLDTFLRERGIAGPDLLKLDVEGAECLVLEGLGTRLAEARPMVLVELKTAEHAAQIQTLFEGLEYHFFRVHEVSGPERIPSLTAAGVFPVSRVCWNFFLCPADRLRGEQVMGVK